MTWKPPNLNELHGPDAAAIRRIFESLAQYLELPEFENGIELGDGVKTYDPTKGVNSPVETHKVIVDSTTNNLSVL